MARRGAGPVMPDDPDASIKFRAAEVLRGAGFVTPEDNLNVVNECRVAEALCRCVAVRV